jgi:hypothetical protein
VGAHFGLIISKAGFQSGASETREATNVHLLNFNTFQETFFDEWRTGIFMKLAQMTDVLSLLIHNKYLTTNKYLTKDPTLEAKLKSVNVFEKYAMFFGKESYSAYFIKRNDLPVVLTDPRGDPHNLTRIKITSFREYFEIASQGISDARRHFGI